MADTTRPSEQGSVEIERIFALQKEAFVAEPFPSIETRRARLDALIRMVEANEARIIEAVNDDFSCRSRHETLVAEVIVSVSAAKAARAHLARWMAPRAVATPLHMKPGKSRLEPQPLGVIGIISPWNYPVQLALSPAAAALAAGNRVMLKPSELTPRTSALLREMARAEFDENLFAVVTGGVEVGQAFSAVPFDHLLYTGSTNVGRHVYMAAAKNLTPVTLELGGKSPAIIDDSADVAAAALSIAHGKSFNAGQTCVAPDYVLAPRAKLDATVDAIASGVRRLYPEIDTTPDYTAIISPRHFARLKAMVAEARDAGVRIVEVGSSNALDPQRKLPVTIVVDPPDTLALMKEEIFGPVLPVIGVKGRDDAIARVNAGDRPLALYWFGEDAAARDDALRRTISGGVTVNDTLWHVAQENLPFGGVGKSGIGAYHGAKGFETFSHMKPVFYQSKFASNKMLYPPFSEKTDKLLKMARKII
ncbi:MAG TPA: coniferyl aldehyde dehydrogenase [Parvularcula sp.]|nr:coniferyl aldehyde dehydrogenase [Parvularcula sp.]HBS34727.1 coniferyl aldehyde dehydrogenase [Parvularcula sp.]